MYKIYYLRSSYKLEIMKLTRTYFAENVWKSKRDIYIPLFGYLSSVNEVEPP